MVLCLRAGEMHRGNVSGAIPGSVRNMHIIRLDIAISQRFSIVVTAVHLQKRCKITTYFPNYQTFPTKNFNFPRTVRRLAFAPRGPPRKVAREFS